MARFRVLLPSLVGDRLQQPGDIVELPPGVLAGSNLMPLDAEAVALRESYDGLLAAAMPVGSPTRRAVEVQKLENVPLTERQVVSLYPGSPEFKRSRGTP